ncbi:hypothetical protein RhiirA1_463835 [Rhizophagus irregularis]|uniref:Uncharacterized protein n=1 Tax=Rhizophagus irregularis TaxID=588596 RepID=A0A2I1EQB8_9GLOM|nr:hypothetical protein RhiirA1_463835 [Rhizophagus irregularis]PKY24327.1 hypothetical protein RhiirB3_438840 [Rhizophagus irregularis]
MFNLNIDILILIFEELQYNKSIRNVRNTLYSCLLVNKTWCSVIIPILWKNPWSSKKSNNNVIISHLSNEAKKNLRNQIKNGKNASTILQRPLYNYVSFCKYLDFYHLDKLLFRYTRKIEKSKQCFIADEIWKLFINKNSKFTHLKITSCNYDQIFLIPGAEHCFSELKFLEYDSRDNQKLLEWLAKISKSIKKFELLCEWNSEIKNLIEAQNNLNSIVLHKLDDKLDSYSLKILTKHNLISLHIKSCFNLNKHLSLPNLKFLTVESISTENLVIIIECTKGYLTEISINEFIGKNNRYIKSIYQNCPNLRYLKLPLIDDEVSELEILLTKCKCLVELFIIETYYGQNSLLGWDELLEILAKSSPTSLFKFKFYFTYELPILETFKLFLDNWKGRHPILLQTNIYDEDFLTLIKKYIDEGIVKSHNNIRVGLVYFEWIQEYNYNNGYIYTI